MPAAPRQVCIACSYSDDVTGEIEASGLWRYTCTSDVHPEPYIWLNTNKGNLPAGHDGLSEQLGIYDDLLGCFTAGEPFLEYGIVEHRYATNHPDKYKHLVSLYSHTRLQRPLDYSASAFIGAALGKLYRDGLLARRTAPTTGYWSYNGILHGWSRTPGPSDGAHLSWKDFAQANSVDPEDWPQSLLP